MGREITAGGKVAERLKQRARMTGVPTEHLLRQYVNERVLYRLSEAFGSSLMLKGSMAAWKADPVNARHAPDIDFIFASALKIST